MQHRHALRGRIAYVKTIWTSSRERCVRMTKCRPRKRSGIFSLNGFRTNAAKQFGSTSACYSCDQCIVRSFSGPCHAIKMPSFNAVMAGPTELRYSRMRMGPPNPFSEKTVT